MWGLTGHSKNWIDIWIVTTTLEGNPASKLLEVYLSVAVSIELVEKSSQLVIVKHTTDCFKSLFELVRTNSSVTFQVKVFEKSFGSLSLIICAVSSLTDFFKNNCLDLSKSRSRNNRSIGVQSPRFQDNLHEVSFLLGGQNRV